MLWFGRQNGVIFLLSGVYLASFCPPEVRASKSRNKSEPCMGDQSGRVLPLRLVTSGDMIGRVGTDRRWRFRAGGRATAGGTGFDVIAGGDFGRPARPSEILSMFNRKGYTTRNQVWELAMSRRYNRIILLIWIDVR